MRSLCEMFHCSDEAAVKTFLLLLWLVGEVDPWVQAAVIIPKVFNKCKQNQTATRVVNKTQQQNLQKRIWQILEVYICWNE